jgi:hypothetical protein
VAEIDVAVAVEIDAVFDVGRRQKAPIRSRNGRSPRCTIFSAASNSPWNSSVRRQSCAMVASVRITGILPMSPLP